MKLRLEFVLAFSFMVVVSMLVPIPVAKATLPMQVVELTQNVPMTANPLGAVITPAANITLAANTRQQIPGSYCTVQIYNPSTTEPLYYGGSTVTTALGQPLCANGTLCPSDTVVIDVKNAGGVWLISTNVLAGIRYMLGTGC